MSSPTSRTLERLRKLGFLAQVVEKWIPQTKQRKDLFGVIDIVAVAPGVILGVQATAMSGGTANARVEKALAEPRLEQWLLANGRFEVWAWSKRGARGKAKRWAVVRKTIELVDGMMCVSEWSEPQ